MNVTNDPAANEFATESLENLRRRLLDLTARNRLLNFTHGRAGNVRIIDELPDALHRLLLSEEELRFEAVPDPTREELIEFGYIETDPETGLDRQLRKDPTAAEWAGVLGYATGYELPVACGDGEVAAKHRDRAIQTLTFPAEMEARLRRLRNSAETAIEETGTNICYVAFGFLERFEGSGNDKGRLAPLLLVPVRIARGRLNRERGTYDYTIAYTGEEILPNLSLRELLRTDFGLALPDLDEDTRPEAYFDAVRELIRKRQPLWKVRRYATVSLFNFSKLLMYLDLDPHQWPGHRPITGHPIVSRFFATRSEGGSAAFGTEYAIDDLPDVHRDYPIIDDADSSQHSALVDAIQGKNLVIEGPPGTGKSQTITNLIAAALAQGKKVLFVAEKLAALEVVKRRLDHAGLGDFCLELHSHKTQKRKVLDDIAARLNNQQRYRKPARMEADIQRYEELKDELRGYAEQINSEWEQTGLTIHRILSGATRHREALGIDPTRVHPEGFDGDMLTPEMQRRSLDTVRVFADVHRGIAAQLGTGAELSRHPWFGVGNRDLQIFDTDRVVAALERWQQALEALAGLVRQAAQRLGAESDREFDGFEALERLIVDLASLPPLEGDERLAALPSLRGEALEALDRHLQTARRARAIRQELSARLAPEAVGDAEVEARLRAAGSQLDAFGFGADFPLERVGAYLRDVEPLAEGLEQVAQPMVEVATRIGRPFSEQVRPTEAGIREFRDFVDLVNRIRPVLLGSRGDRFEDDALDETLPALNRDLAALEAARAELQPVFALDRLPPAAELAELRQRLARAGLFRWFDASYRGARARLRQLAAHPGARMRDLLARADRLHRYAEHRAVVGANPQYRPFLGDALGGMPTDVDEFIELRSWYKAVRERFGVGFGPRVWLGDTVLEMSPDRIRGIQSLAQQGLLDRVDDVLARLDETRRRFGGCARVQQRGVLLVGSGSPIAELRSGLRESVDAIAGGLAADAGTTLESLHAVIARIDELHSLRKAWAAERVRPEGFDDLIDWTRPPDLLGEGELAPVEHTAVYARLLDREVRSDLLRNAIYREPERALIDTLAELRHRLEAALQAQRSERQAFAELTELDTDAWEQQARGSLSGLLERNRRAVDRRQWLGNWVDYVRVRAACEAAGFRGLARAVEVGAVELDAILDGFWLGVYDLLARQILKEVPGLARFSGNAQQALQRQFREYDEKLKQLQRQRIAAQVARNRVPEGSAGGKVSSYTDLALLQHEVGKKKRHIPLRQLVLRAGNALAALKPCFMMGPMSVAQYLPRGEIEFDLVVMDEASQMKPEDALGAIARGGQLVVVGDPKQLPPTSFFDRMIGEDDEDTTAIEDSESILDTALPLFHARRLTWHYRSRHEHLIAFSNHSFYDGTLVVFPAPHAESDDFGVKLTRVPRGRFVNRRNVEEARIIARAVHAHLLLRPDESLGVVAMSAEQRDQIEREVEDLSKEDAGLRDALEARSQTEEPLFIKNLENVQGDERDVIYISCTYGPEEVGGRVYQRFGPINSDVGWRRLNVLFTRSKKRMHVFSSMGSGDIALSERSRRGVVAFREFLAFAETGRLRQDVATDVAEAGDFEASVSAVLGREGFECVPRVGVAGFFIDLAVRDPGRPGHYLAGIESDGPAYRSGRSVRDRDRLRQAVLERLGWRIHRIWSTDWYRNPQGEIEPIIRELHARRTPVSEPTVPLAEFPAAAHALAPEEQEPTEAEAIERIVEQEEDLEIEVDESVPPGLDLRERLIHFDRDVIRSELPDTPDNQRLLRPAMLEALLEFRPTSKGEFVEKLPLYLRQATSPREAKYLDRVLKIIEESEVNELR